MDVFMWIFDGGLTRSDGRRLTCTSIHQNRELPWRDTLRLAFGLWRQRALGGGGRSRQQPQQQLMVPAAAGGGEAVAAAAMSLGARRMVGACVEMVRFDVLLWVGAGRRVVASDPPMTTTTDTHTDNPKHQKNRWRRF